jgi:hypothetical protein
MQFPPTTIYCPILVPGLLLSTRSCAPLADILPLMCETKFQTPNTAVEITVICIQTSHKTQQIF